MLTASLVESFDKWSAAKVRHWLGTVAKGQILPYITHALHADEDEAAASASSSEALTGAKLLKMSRARLAMVRCPTHWKDSEVGCRLQSQ